ncbi:MlaD family protein [Jannaschia formosa]|uniref:MlaD family protein n=1 Tax=Jannaschia formosa TaxID=2259592 RepID=UPI000E1BB9C1|nr:MlaD family protein [Jannaschia formosa]TFL17668.1 MCE family protein [Jannaschia formosa]
MTDTPSPQDRPPAPQMERPRRRRMVSAVWLVPIVAVIIALAIAWQSYANRGVLIAIAFPDASGVQIGTTQLRFREVTVGVVEDVGFSADLTQVNVYVRVSRNIAPYLDEDAAFWVVQPEVTTRGVEGLNTILSGTYIQGTWDSEIGEPQTAFLGNERAPIVPPGVEGTAIVLASRESSRLGPGAPILYRGIEVGEVAQPRLSPDGSEIRIDAFVRAPYDRQLSTATRFWDASGVSVDIGAGGVELNIGSIATLVEGGLNFDTLISGGSEIEPGHVFTIYADEEAARASTFESPAQRSILVSTLLPASQQGLTVGAPVRYQGQRVGTVASITGFVRPDDPTGSVELLAVMSLQPAKMGLEGMQTDLEGIDFITELVNEEGLRARPAATGLLGGSLAVELVELPDPPPARVEIGVTDTPLLPAVEGEESGLAASASSVLDRLAALPVEELLDAATSLLNNVNSIAADESTRAIPGAALSVLEESQGLIAEGRSVIAAPEIARTLASIDTAAADIAALSQALREREVARELAETLGSANIASDNIARATQDLDELVADLAEVSAAARTILADPATQAIPGAALAAVEDGQGLIRDGRAILSSPQVASVLIDIETLADDLATLSQQLVETGLVTQVTSTLETADAAAGNIARGTQDLDALTASIRQVAEEAGALLADEATRALPGAALATLEEGQALIAEGREIVASGQIATILDEAAQATARINSIVGEFSAAALAPQITEAVSAATTAARNIADATVGLDAIAQGVDRVVASADALLASEEAQALPGAALATLQEGQALIAEGREIVAGGQIAAILDDAAAATATINDIVGELGAAALAPQITEAVSAATTAARNIADGTVGLENIAQGIDRVVASADTLLASQEVQALPGATLGLIEDGRALVASPEITTLIRELSETATSIRTITTQLAAEDAASRLTAALAAAEEAAQSVAEGTRNLPSLSASAERVLAQAEELGAGLNRLTVKAESLALEELVNATTDLMVTADAFLSSDEAGDVPVVLSNTLEELRLTIETIRTGGTLENLNRTLVSAGNAADSVAQTTGELPALVQRLAALTEQAGTLLESYSDGSRVNQELYAALRAATRAAEDVSSLSRTIERNPNSLLLGR